MTVSSAYAPDLDDGDGVSVIFPVTFRFDSTADVRCTIFDVDGVARTPAFTVTGTGDPGGSVEITDGAPLAGEKVLRWRETELLQQVNYEAGDFPSAAHERSADRLVMAAQERARIAARTLRFNDLTDPIEPISPVAVGRALVRTEEGFGEGPTADEVASAQGYAESALASRNAAAASEANAEADRVATAADRVQTGLDRVATGEDAAATAADRVATGEDAAATAADRVQTGLDRTAAEEAAADAAASAGSIDTTRVVPSGAVSYFAMNTPPDGWLKANGALVSRATYAALFAAIGTTFGAGDGATTFALPDLRGEFLRAWDDGRGVDSGRSFGSAQSDANKAHSHGGATVSNGDHSHGLEQYRNSAGNSGSGNGSGDGGLAFLVSDNNSTPGWFAVPTTASTTTGSVRVTTTGAHTHTINSDGGTEARPRNVALLACIKF